MRSRKLHLLVAINGNLSEWQGARMLSRDRPRLPLPYTFGAAMTDAGFVLSAIDLGGETGLPGEDPSDIDPFEAIYSAVELQDAIESADIALLWGRPALSALVRRALLPWTKRRVFFLSYVWSARGIQSIRRRCQIATTRHAARFARGIVLMTAEQATAARATLPGNLPVIELQVGIDCQFYFQPTALSDIAEADRDQVERLLQSPYVIMPGDGLRLNDDALSIVETTSLNLVRISQYGQLRGIPELKAEIARRGLGDHLVVFERISYPALRFLMRHAVAYCGLVDATWQPAGWTVACESLACGLPVVLYEGLTSREMNRLGAGPNILRSVAMHDTCAFASELLSAAATSQRSELAAEARAFAAGNLDLEKTGSKFGAQLARAATVG